MKKLFAALLSVLLVTAIALPVSAAGGAEYTLPGWAQKGVSPTGDGAYAMPEWVQPSADRTLFSGLQVAAQHGRQFLCWENVSPNGYYSREEGVLGAWVIDADGNIIQRIPEKDEAGRVASGSNLQMY